MSRFINDISGTFTCRSPKAEVGLHRSMEKEREGIMILSLPLSLQSCADAPDLFLRSFKAKSWLVAVDFDGCNGVTGVCVEGTFTW